MKSVKDYLKDFSDGGIKTPSPFQGGDELVPIVLIPKDNGASEEL